MRSMLPNKSQEYSEFIQIKSLIPSEEKFVPHRIRISESQLHSKCYKRQTFKNKTVLLRDRKRRTARDFVPRLCVAIFVSPFFLSPFFVSPFFVSPFSQKKKNFFSSPKKNSFFKKKKKIFQKKKKKKFPKIFFFFGGGGGAGPWGPPRPRPRAPPPREQTHKVKT